MEVEEREGRTTHKLLALWTKREEEWLAYKEIVNELKAYGISERTVDRHLSTLVRERKLVKEERGYKKTFYRPHDEFLRSLSSSRDLFRIHEESLSRIGKYVMDTMEKSVVEAKETTERIGNLVEKEIDKLSESEKDSEEGIEKAVIHVLSEESLTKEESKTLASLLDVLLEKTIHLCLSNPYVFGRIVDPYDLASILDDDVWALVSSYMDLWAFMYKHPSALSEFRRHMQKNNSERTS